MFVRFWGHVSYLKPNDLLGLIKLNCMYVRMYVRGFLCFWEREGETSTRLTIFPSYTPFLRSLLPPYFLNFHLLPFPTFLLSILFYQWPTAQWQQPYWLAMPAAQLVCFLYNITIPSKQLMRFGLYNLNIYHLKRHHNSVNLNLF